MRKTVPWSVFVTLVWCWIVLGIWIWKDPIYILNLSNTQQMSKFLKRVTRFDPVPFENDLERQYFYNLCTRRLDSRQILDKQKYQDANVLMLGKHPSLPNVYACVITVVTDKEAASLCKLDGKDFVRNDSEKSHEVICRFQIE